VKAVIVAIKAEAVKTETDWGLTAAILGVLLVVGIAVRYLLVRRR
jgi:hypothetical protein